MNPEIVEKNEALAIILSGELTVQRALEMKELLLANILPERTIELDIAQVKEIDISGLQLLCSAHRTAQARGGDIHLNPPLSALFEQTVQAAGFKRHRDCCLDRHHTCLWNYGEHK